MTIWLDQGAGRHDWADELAGAVDRLAEELQTLDNQFSARLFKVGLHELQEILPDVRRQLNYIVAVLACLHAASGYPDRTSELPTESAARGKRCVEFTYEHRFGD